jgi:hypothetical protein
LTCALGTLDCLLEEGGIIETFFELLFEPSVRVMADFSLDLVVTMPFEKRFAGVAAGLHPGLESRVYSFLRGGIGFLELVGMGFGCPLKAFLAALAQDFLADFIANAFGIAFRIKERIRLGGFSRAGLGLLLPLLPLGTLGPQGFQLGKCRPLFLVDLPNTP